MTEHNKKLQLEAQRKTTLHHIEANNWYELLIQYHVLDNLVKWQTCDSFKCDLLLVSKSENPQNRKVLELVTD